MIMGIGIGKLLGTIGVPVLLKFLKDSLGGMDSSAAQAAAGALGELDKEIKGRKISLDEIREANRHIESMNRLEAELDAKTLAEINGTIQKEMLSGDRFVRFWRPFFGYAVSFAWLAMMLAVCFIIVCGRPDAADIIMALVETTSLWGIALGVLGVSVVKRSQEKRAGSGGEGREDILSKVINKIT